MYRFCYGGPLDERPEPDGTRLRDTQCGLFATGKVLRRFGIPFTYMTRISGKDRDNIKKCGHGELLHVHGLKKINICQTDMEDR